MRRPITILQNSTQRLFRVLSKIGRVRFIYQSWSIAAQTTRGFIHDDCLIMAAAVSFYAVLSLIPFLLLVFSIAGHVLNRLGQDYGSQQELFAQLTTYVQAVVPFLEEEILEDVRGVVTNRQTYGITGLAILLVTAGLVFRSLELAFVRIFKNKRQRSLVASQLLFVLFLFTVGLAFLLFYHLGVLTSVFYSAIDKHFHEKAELILTQYALLRALMTLSIATAVFVVLLKYFSREKIRLLFVLEGGVLFSLLWILAVRAFGYYLAHIAQFSLLYGSLATLAIIVVWIFYSACILLLCAEFTHVLQTNNANLASPEKVNQCSKR